MPLPEKQDYLFVYGSLQRGANHPAHKILTRYADFVCAAEYEGLLFLVKDYPGVISAEQPSSRVSGELYRLNEPETVFMKLDRYEGYNPDNPSNSLYIRKKCTIYCQSNSRDSISAWIYLFNRPTKHLKQIKSGDYLSYIQNQ